MLTFLTQFVLLHFTSATKEGSENILIMLPQNRLSTPLLHLVLKWEIQLPRLQHIYNTAARVFTLTKHSLIKPVLLDLHRLPIASRIIYKHLLIVFNSLNGQAPAYILDMHNIYKPSRNLCSANRYLLQEIKSNHTWGTDIFSVAAPHLWNQLPLYIKTSISIHSFKASLKTHLMSIDLFFCI